MGNASIKYINFEEVQYAIISNKATIINTLPITDQICLITGSVLGINEETTINEILINNKHVQIVVYGKNCSDISATKKAIQLQTLGCSNVCVYGGGLFEWLLLQDIYGKTEFKTTNKIVDLLKYK